MFFDWLKIISTCSPIENYLHHPQNNTNRPKKYSFTNINIPYDFDTNATP